MPPPLTFLRAAETWVPSPDRKQLLAAPNSFASTQRLAALGREEGFPRGQGLPGRAWDEGRPILMRELDTSYFQRAAAARDAGISCAMAVPIFVGGSLTSVLVLFCGHVEARPAALELWHADTQACTDMTLVDGVYGPGAPTFEQASRATVLPRGEGLPGLAWHRGEAQFVDHLAQAPASFVRAREAGDAGMRRGLAIPFGSRTDGGYVVALLAGTELPLALAVERWKPDDARARLVRSDAFSERQGGRSNRQAELSLRDGAAERSSIAAAFATGVPAISDLAAAARGAPAALASTISASAVVCIPVIWGGSLIREVVAIYI